MKLALLSDLHGNAHALRACMAHARAQGFDRLAVLGDLVGYGAEPGVVVDWAVQAVQDGGIVLRGNHDEAASRAPAGGDRSEDLSSAWTHAQLQPAQRSFLAGLPLVATVDGVLLVHASAHEPGQWLYIDRPERALQALRAAEDDHGVKRVLAGHMHEQRLYYRGRGSGLLPFTPTPGIAIPLRAHPAWVATIGSVGQPRDGDPRAMYAMLDTAGDRLTFHRVAYEHGAAARAIRASRLPAGFAERLELGR